MYSRGLYRRGFLDMTEATIGISNYTPGFYTVALICNGTIIDAKNLVKQ
ncbi:MAG TPA: hypothetical protein P5188_13220 [Flavobacterium sp.]|nr:hypothetical protein [Flavobacterium sp.]HRZ33265.1 hypothetical protein [Flavobacterium sp.]